jgi:hypothetical protein
MFKVALFFGLFVAIMVYRMVVIYRNQGVQMPKAKAKAGMDENVINDPGLFWHPLNHHRD